MLAAIWLKYRTVDYSKSNHWLSLFQSTVVCRVLLLVRTMEFVINPTLSDWKLSMLNFVRLIYKPFRCFLYSCVYFLTRVSVGVTIFSWASISFSYGARVWLESALITRYLSTNKYPAVLINEYLKLTIGWSINNITSLIVLCMVLQ